MHAVYCLQTHSLRACDQANTRWVRLGCMLLNDLLASPDGLRFLAEDEFLEQLMKSFAQLDPVCYHLIFCASPIFT